MFLVKRNNVVYVVDGKRTPFIKAGLVPAMWTASDLTVQTGQSLLLEYEHSIIDEVILGCVMPNLNEANIARIVALRLGLHIKTPAWTVQRNCGSGLQALDSAMQSIRSGRSECVLAGGTEVMSRAPLWWNHRFLHWLGEWRQWKYEQRKKTISWKNIHQSGRDFLNRALKFQWSFFKPEVALLAGLTDPISGLNMGQTAEELATAFNISRDAMDQYALQSHQRLAKAYENNAFKEEIVPLIDSNSGKIYNQDTGLRVDITLDALARLSPVFDKPYGRVTAGNSSQITDGACVLLLASEKAVKQHNWPVLGKLHQVTWSGVEPEKMGLGPVSAISALLKQCKMTADEIDYWEINEAFSAQVLADLKELPINQNKVNVDGGAISMGHPVGASGARIVLHLLHVLKQRGGKKGVAALCVGGGQGGAILVES